MIRGMPDTPSGDENWRLYILRCGDGSLYTGVTKDLEKRLKLHREGKASKFTRSHQPVELVYDEPCGNRKKALVRECQVKSYTRAEKLKLAGLAGDAS
jgi:putative endonuclease